MKSAFFAKEDVELIKAGKTFFTGALFMADISGFTNVTEILAGKGRKGTEELTALLNRCFDTMLNTVAEHDGAVISFSGDSIAVRFRDEDSASICGEAILASMRTYRRTVIFGQRFPISVKVVVGKGSWHEYIIGNTRRAHVYLAGELVREIARREDTALPGTLIEFECSEPQETTAYSLPETSADSFLSIGSERLHGEHRPVTPLFISVSQRDGGALGADEFQQIYLQVQSSVIAHGGYMHHVDDLVPSGSRILALFGAPVSAGGDTLNAVSAALELVNKNELRNRYRIACGIDTGYVYAGLIGNKSRMQYTVIGDPVNTAARLAETSEPGQVTVTSNVTAATHKQVLYSSGSKIPLKGKSSTIQVSIAEMLQLDEDKGAEVIGRQKETAHLVEKISSDNNLVILSGAAGIGKTTILLAVESILEETGCRVIRAEKTRNGPATDILLDLLKDVCGIGERTPPEQWEDLLDTLLDHLGNTQLSRRKIFLARMILGLKIPHDTFDNLPPKLRSENLLDAMILLFTALPGKICTFIEDIHYASKEEASFLIQLIQGIRARQESKVTFLLTTRPEGTGVLPEGTSYYRYDLQGLSDDESSNLLVHYSDMCPVDEEIEELLSNRAQGNPFFLVQFLLYLREKQLITLSEGKWVKSGSGSLDSLPESVFSMIMARIDTLEERTRESLKVASVVGMRFTENVISRIVQRDVHGDMSESIKAGLTFINSYAELEHIFSHMLIRDVAYDSILSDRKQKLHRDIGLILEEKATESRESLESILAYHFTRGEIWDKAARYSMAAADRAADEFRNQDALELYLKTAAIYEEHLPGERQLLAICKFRTGSLLDRTGDYQEASDAYRRVISLSTDMALTGKSLMGIADILFHTGKMKDGLDLMEEIQRLIPQAGSEAQQLELKVAAYRAWTNCVSGDIAAAEKEALKAVAIGESMENVSEKEKASKLGHAYNTLATVYWADSKYPKAKELYEKAVGIAVENGLKREAAVTWGNIGLVLEKQGKYLEAVEGMNKQLRMSTEIGEKLLILSAYGDLGMTYSVLGDFDRALENSLKQLELASSMKVTHDLMLANNHLASLYVTMGEMEKASRHVETAMKLAEENSMERVIAHSSMIMARMQWLNGCLPEALDLFKKAENIAAKVNSHTIQQMCAASISKLMIESDELEEAEKWLEKATSVASEAQLVAGTAQCHRVRGELFFAKGKNDKAAEQFTKGIAMFRELGTKYSLAEALESFGRQLAAEQEDDSSVTRGRDLLEAACGLFLEMGLEFRARDCN